MIFQLLHFSVQMSRRTVWTVKFCAAKQLPWMAKQPPRKIAPLDGKIAPLKKKSNLGNGKIAPLSFEIQVKFSQNSSPQRFVAKSLLFFVATLFLHIFLPIQPIYFLCNDLLLDSIEGLFCLPIDNTFFANGKIGNIFCRNLFGGAILCNQQL